MAKGDGLGILLVQSDDPVHEAVFSIARRNSYGLTVRDSAKGGLGSLGRTQKYGLVLVTDWLEPGNDAFVNKAYASMDFIEHLRVIPVYARTPLVVLATVSGDVLGGAEAFKKAGADRYLSTLATGYGTRQLEEVIGSYMRSYVRAAARR